MGARPSEWRFAPDGRLAAASVSSWSHERGVPSKVIAELMGHSTVDMTLNTYTQVMPNALQEAVSSVSEELFRIVHSPEGRSELTH